MNQIDEVLTTLTKEEIDALMNDEQVIEDTAEEILQEVFDRR